MTDSPQTGLTSARWLQRVRRLAIRPARRLLHVPGRYSPARLFVITVAGIAMAEVVAMLVVYRFRDWPYVQQIVMDAAIMEVIIFPLLYFLIFRPWLQHNEQRAQAETALRQSEAKFRTFVDWTYDWEMWVDPQGEIVYASPSCERISGYSPAEFASNPGLLSAIVHPDDLPSYHIHRQLVHDKSAGQDGIEYRIIACDGREVWIEHLCRPLFAPDGRYLGRRISNRDISERKQAEFKIWQQTQKELVLTQTLQNIRTDIARDLHDMLGQNISLIRMNLDYLSEAEWSDLDKVRAKIQGMTGVANESYDLIRAMLAVLQLDISADPLSLFSQYAGQVAGRAGFEVRFSSQGQTRQLSPAKMRQLFYIFREALSNIEKYAGARQVTVEFIWDHDTLQLVIADDGRGFDAQVALDNGANGHYGLRFMRERAELLKGSFSIQSTPGQGAVIRVLAPWNAETQVQAG